ncbi:hypothetical protein PR048_031679 [Dryococelus australis]|uniref:Phosphodiesterase n=1 Tax=Dryococelus australis TaxID=614101 RepID=A0ABQ9G5Z2_9NEOP|nr:hypothetical protein PR048_031679 [Dryococelus australis]
MYNTIVKSEFRQLDIGSAIFGLETNKFTNSCRRTSRSSLSLHLAGTASSNVLAGKAFLCQSLPQNLPDLAPCVLYLFSQVKIALKAKTHLQPDEEVRRMATGLGPSLPMSVKRGEYGAAPGMKGRGKRDIPEKTHWPAASSGTIPACENHPAGIQTRIRTAGKPSAFDQSGPVYNSAISSCLLGQEYVATCYVNSVKSFLSWQNWTLPSKCARIRTAGKPSAFDQSGPVYNSAISSCLLGQEYVATCYVNSVKSFLSWRNWTLPSKCARIRTAGKPGAFDQSGPVYNSAISSCLLGQEYVATCYVNSVKSFFSWQNWTLPSKCARIRTAGKPSAFDQSGPVYNSAISSCLLGQEYVATCYVNSVKSFLSWRNWTLPSKCARIRTAGKPSAFDQSGPVYDSAISSCLLGQEYVDCTATEQIRIQRRNGVVVPLMWAYPFSDWLWGLWERASCLIGYSILQKLAHYLSCRLASRIPGADWLDGDDILVACAAGVRGITVAVSPLYSVSEPCAYSLFAVDFESSHFIVNSLYICDTSAYPVGNILGCQTFNTDFANLRQKRGPCPESRSERNWMTDLEIFATLLAAIIHDYEHTGTTNNFHVMSGTETALLYNDRAVLENHHISASFRSVRTVASGRQCMSQVVVSVEVVGNYVLDVYGAALKCKGGENLEKTCQLAASISTIPICENLWVTSQGNQHGSLWWKASVLPLCPPQPLPLAAPWNGEEPKWQLESIVKPPISRGFTYGTTCHLLYSPNSMIQHGASSVLSSSGMCPQSPRLEECQATSALKLDLRSVVRTMAFELDLQLREKVEVRRSQISRAGCVLKYDCVVSGRETRGALSSCGIQIIARHKSGRSPRVSSFRRLGKLKQNALSAAWDLGMKS